MCAFAKTCRSEIFPTHIRSQGMAVSMAGIYLADILLLIAGPIALDKIGWKFFFVLIIPTFFNLLFVWFFCPETKNRSLEDINALFGEQVAIRYYGATEDEKIALEKAAMADKEQEELSHSRTGKIAQVEQREVA